MQASNQGQRSLTVILNVCFTLVTFCYIDLEILVVIYQKEQANSEALFNLSSGSAERFFILV